MVFAVALLNLSYFGVEFAVALAIGSVSLFADSIDFLEDTSVNLLIFFGMAWSATNRSRLGMALALILLVPGLAVLWTAWGKFLDPLAPAPLPLSLAGLGALAVNLSCALTLARYRHHKASLTTAAFLSARNDALANIAIIAAGWDRLHLALRLARSRQTRHCGHDTDAARTCGRRRGGKALKRRRERSASE